MRTHFEKSNGNKQTNSSEEIWKNWILTLGQIDVRTSVLLVDGCQSLSIVQNILDSTKKIIENFQ